MLKRSDVNRAVRCARGGSGMAHTKAQSSQRSSIASVVGSTGRTIREAHFGQLRHSDCGSLPWRDIGAIRLSGASRGNLTAPWGDLSVQKNSIYDGPN